MEGYQLKQELNSILLWKIYMTQLKFFLRGDKNQLKSD